MCLCVYAYTQIIYVCVYVYIYAVYTYTHNVCIHTHIKCMYTYAHTNTFPGVPARSKRGGRKEREKQERRVERMLHEEEMLRLGLPAYSHEGGRNRAKVCLCVCMCVCVCVCGCGMKKRCSDWDFLQILVREAGTEPMYCHSHNN